MLNFINILTLSTALTLQPTTQNIHLNYNSTNIKSISDLTKEGDQYAYTLLRFDNNKEYLISVNFTNYTETKSINIDALENAKYQAIGYQNQNTDIEKYKEYNKTTYLTTSDLNYYTETFTKYNGIGNYTIDINIRSKTFMEELLTALTTAVQSAVSIFVEGFGGLTQIFYNGTEITFIGGILIVGLAVMFLMMFLRWIVSFVKGI